MAKILLPTDFSDNSLNACAYALDLLGAEGHEYLLLHAYLPVPPDHAVLPNVSDELYRASMDGMKEFLKRIKELKNARSVIMKTEVEFGPLSSLAVQLCQEQGVDLVVMGTQGRTGVPFVGSHAAELAKQSRVPVLIVPKEARFKGLRQILFADDHKSVEPLAMRWMIRMAQQHDATITVAHVLRKEVEEPDPLIVEEYRAALAKVKHDYIGIPGKELDVAVALSDVAERDRMDLVVVLHRHLGVLDSLFHRSTAKALVLHTHLPLLVLEH